MEAGRRCDRRSIRERDFADEESCVCHSWSFVGEDRPEEGLILVPEGLPGALEDLMTVQETQSQIASVALAIFFATFFTLVRKFPTVSAVCLIVVATIATNLGEAITINEALRLLTRIITITTATDCAPLGKSR